MYCKRLIFIGALISVFTLSGCSFLPFFGDKTTTYRHSGQTKRPVNECTHNVQSCMYEGPYEKGEYQFALEEARRLNAASLERLRRNAIDMD